MEKLRNLRIAPTLYAGFVWSKPRTGTSSPSATTHVMYFVERCETEPSGTVIHLRRQHPQGSIEIWQTRDLISPLPSQIVFIVGNRLSYLDPQSLEIVESRVSTPHRPAAAVNLETSMEGTQILTAVNCPRIGFTKIRNEILQGSVRPKLVALSSSPETVVGALVRDACVS